ncbi:hypothetical protein BDW72DRAFT_130097 [Aspergillus terricola var. indicus]
MISDTRAWFPRALREYRMLISLFRHPSDYPPMVPSPPGRGLRASSRRDGHVTCPVKLPPCARQKAFFIAVFSFFLFYFLPLGGETIPVLPDCMPVPGFRLVGESGKGPRPQAAGCIERAIWEVNKSVPEGSCKDCQGRESGQYNGRPTRCAAGGRPLPPPVPATRSIPVRQAL